jgi:elongation factor 1-gamma
MSYKLYSPQNYATAGAKVELLLRFIDLPVEIVRIGWDQIKSPEYLAKHPLGKVPTLETPEGKIFESNSILRYLARKAGKLDVNSPAETASIDQWLEFLNSQLTPINTCVTNITLGFYPPTTKCY